MKPDALLVTVNFPSSIDNKDGQANYVSKVARSLNEEMGMYLTVIAFRCGEQEPLEKMDGLLVKRIDLPNYVSHYSDIYDHKNFKTAVSALAEGASLAITETGHNLPVWCHGYETGSTACKLRKRGCPIVGVVHYLVIQDLIHRIEVAKDPLGKRHYPLTIASALGTVCPKKYHNPLMRFIIRNSPSACKLPVPGRLEILTKIEQELQLIRSAHKLIAVSPGFADTISEFYPDASHKISHCVAGSPTISSDPYWPFPIRDHRLRLIMVGRPAPQKGWDYFTAALKNLEKKYPNEASRIELVVIGGLGDWGNDYSLKLKQSLLLLKHVSLSFMGEIPNQRVLTLMSAADALIVPSVFEPFGLVLIEAMAAGCLVLSSDTDGPRDIVKSPWGMLMNFQDSRMRVSEIERGILELLSLSRDQIKRLGEKARKASLDYSWKKCANAHSRALESAGAHVNA